MNISNNYLEVNDRQNDRLYECLFKEMMSTKRSEVEMQEDIMRSKIEGFCLKTRNIETNEKIFVNLCHSSMMRAPTLDLNEDELRALLASEDATSFTIPMLLTSFKTTLDKSGSKALVLDVIINTDFYINKILLSQLYKTFLITVSLETIERDKYKARIEKNDWILLKNKKYQQMSDSCSDMKSDDNIINDLNSFLNINDINNDSNDRNDGLDYEYINTNNNKLIENISYITNDDINGPKTESDFRHKEGVVSADRFQGQPSVPAVLTPKCKLKYDLVNNCMNGEIVMPLVCTASHIDLLIGEDRIVLSANDYKLDIFVPLFIDAQHVSATFDSFSHVLHFKMPLI